MYEKMMEKNLAEKFGTRQIISEVDALVFADDDIRMAHYDAKDARARRFQKTDDKKRRNKALYLLGVDVKDITFAHKTYFDRDDVVGIVPVFHGQEKPVSYIKKGRKFTGESEYRKAQNRKVRHTRFTEPMPEQPIIGEITVAPDDEDMTWQYQTLPLGERIESSCYDVLWDYAFQRRVKLHELEVERAMLMAKIHRLDRQICRHIAGE